MKSHFYSGSFSSIDDHQLDEMNTVASSQHPGTGMRMLQGNLRASGHCIQRDIQRDSNFTSANRSHWCGTKMATNC